MYQYIVQPLRIANSRIYFTFISRVRRCVPLRLTALYSVFQLSRNQRFTASFHHAVETLVNMLMPHITQKYKDNLDAARNANHSLAVFIKVPERRLSEFAFPNRLGG